MMFKFKPMRLVSAAALIGMAALAVADHASAASGQTNNCIIYSVDADYTGTTSRLTLVCTGDATHVYTAGYSGCMSTPIEQLKLWHAQAMAAMLSGHQTTFYWDDSCGTRAIYGFLTSAS